MAKAARIAAKLFVTALAAACSAIISLALVNWAMADRFYLHSSWLEALTVSALAFLVSLFGSLFLFGIFALLGRIRAPSQWSGAAVGGILVSVFPVLLLGDLGSTLVVLPAGIVAGFLAANPTATTISRRGSIVLACGLVVWSVLVLMPVAAALRENEGAKTADSSPLGEFVMGGAALGSELWLFNEAGKAVSFRLTDWQPTIRAHRGIAALAERDGTMWALVAPAYDSSAKQQPAGRFRLARYAAGHWSYSAWQSYPLDEKPFAFALGRDGAVVLGPKRLYVQSYDLGRVLVRALSKRIEGWGRFRALIVGNETLYLGANRGEWGGGLFRIDTRSGSVSVVERRDDNGLCSGPLNSECDPVTGVLPDSTHPDCVFASIGLSHMMWTGRVLRVCGARVETVFEAPILPIGVQVTRLLSTRARKIPPETEPVFGLSPAPGGFWAVTPRSLYRWEDGNIDRRSLPRLSRKSGLALSDSVAGLIVVTTLANAADSLSGTTPLIFAAGHRQRP